MKLSEKIQYLRKENCYTQEELAEYCHVSIDTLVKDELTIQGVKEVHCCGKNVLGQSQSVLYEGALIKESIEDENILDMIEVNKMELWKTESKPKYWTVLFFTSRYVDFPDQIAKVMRGGTNETNWFVDFKMANVKYIVFRNLILKYTIGNQEEKDAVCKKCLELGIPEEQMQWSE